MNSTSEHFEALVNEHYYPLFRFAMSLTHAESDARDLTQQTFYTWAAKGHQLRDGAKVKTWLYTTLHRAFLQVRRRQVRFPHHDLEEVAQQLPVQLPEFTNSADCAEVLPALAKVDEVFRAAVALFYLEDCSYKEIAAILDIPVGTVKSRIARGLAGNSGKLPALQPDSVPNRLGPKPAVKTYRLLRPTPYRTLINDYDGNRDLVCHPRNGTQTARLPFLNASAAHSLCQDWKKNFNMKIHTAHTSIPAAPEAKRLSTSRRLTRAQSQSGNRLG